MLTIGVADIAVLNEAMKEACRIRLKADTRDEDKRDVNIDFLHGTH